MLLFPFPFPSVALLLLLLLLLLVAVLVVKLVHILVKRYIRLLLFLSILSLACSSSPRKLPLLPSLLLIGKEAMGWFVKTKKKISK